MLLDCGPLAMVCRSLVPWCDGWPGSCGGVRSAADGEWGSLGAGPVIAFLSLELLFLKLFPTFVRKKWFDHALGYKHYCSTKSPDN